MHNLKLLMKRNIYFFRLYECDVGDTPRLMRTWKVGPTVHSPSKIPNFTSLGDSAVDFDFATPLVKQDYDKDIEVRIQC